jgi:hypothetical protein
MRKIMINESSPFYYDMRSLSSHIFISTRNHRVGLSLPLPGIQPSPECPAILLFSPDAGIFAGGYSPLETKGLIGSK